MIEFLKFYADWCSPCHVIEPFVQELEKEYSGKVNFTKIDVDREGEQVTKFNVLSIPTMILLKNGKEVGRLVGAMSKQMIKSKIEAVLS